MVSIILCTYNREHTLKESIDSILEQTYRDFELIVIDDGSTDHTLELLSNYQDTRIRVFPLEENQYYCAAANFGIGQARGEYIAFATSDDTWEPDKLERQIDYLEARKECGACFTFTEVINESGEKTNEKFVMLSGLFNMSYHTQKDWVQRFIYEGNCVSHPSSVVRRRVLDDVGGYNLLYCQSADMDLWLRIVRKYPIHVIEKKLVCYRIFKNPQAQISGMDERKAARFLNEHMIIRRKFIRDLNVEEMIKFFGDRFRNKDACSETEIEIEKAFLLMNCAGGLPNFRVLGIEKFEELLRNPEAAAVLKEKYGVRLQDIYQWNLEHFYMDFGIHVRLAERDRTVLLLKERLRREEEYTRGLQRMRDGQRAELVLAADTIAGQEEQLRVRQEELEREKESRVSAELKLGIREKELKEAQEENARLSALLNEALLEGLRLKEKEE